MKAVVAAIPHPEFPNLYLHFERQDSKRWTTPGGKLEEGEDPAEGVLREVQEEVGATPDQFEAPVLVNSTVNEHDNGDRVEVLLYLVKPKGEIVFNLKADPDQEGQPGTAVFLDPISTDKPLHHPQARNILVDWIAKQSAKQEEGLTKDETIHPDALLDVWGNAQGQKNYARSYREAQAKNKKPGFHGSAADSIASHSAYQIHDVDPSEIAPDNNSWSNQMSPEEEKYAGRYAKLSHETAPPVVLHPSTNPKYKYEVIDGRHRTRAAAIRGSKVKAAIPIIKSLAKGQNGDWQKEGYTLHHEVAPAQLGLKTVRVTAKDRHGNSAGHVGFNQDWADKKATKPGKTMTAAMVRVDSAHRRKGLASAMYAHAEKVSGLKTKPDSGAQSDEGSALWSQKKRPFGKAEEPQPAVDHFAEWLKHSNKALRSPPSSPIQQKHRTRANMHLEESKKNPAEHDRRMTAMTGGSKPLKKTAAKKLQAFPPNANDKTIPDSPEAEQRRTLRLAPNLVDATQHSAKGMQHSAAQQELHHGVNLSGLDRSKVGVTATQGLLSGTGKNSQGKKVFVKEAWQRGGEIDPSAHLLDPVSHQHYDTFNTAHREALYHNLAHNVFGMGQHVPTTSAFETTHNGKPSTFSAQHFVDDAEAPTMDDYGPESTHAKNGTLHKLAVMNAVMGNYDRHGANYLVSKEKNPDGSGKHLHLIDNGLAFAHGVDSPSNMGASYAAHVADDKLHPEAAKWLHNVNPKKLEAEMRANNTPEPIIARTVNSLQRAQNADKETNGHASLKSIVEDLYNHNKAQHTEKS